MKTDLQAWDIVRVAKLANPPREFVTAAGDRRPAKVGDVGCVARTYIARAGVQLVPVDLVAESFSKIFSAEFSYEELEFDTRPGPPKRQPNKTVQTTAMTPPPSATRMAPLSDP